MHHFFESITNTSGESLVGYFGRVIDPMTQAVVPIYSDDNGTPIVTASGVANMAKTDDAGNLSFFVEPGTYNLDIYQPDASTFLKRVPNLPMNSQKGDKGDPGDQGDPGPADNTYTADNGGLPAFKASDITRKVASLVGIPGVPDGRFNWTLGNYAGQADDINVIKAGSTALSVGAWVRQGAEGVNFDGRPVYDKLRETVSVTDARFAGGAPIDGVNDDIPAIDAAVASLPNGGVVLFPPGFRVTLSRPITDDGKPIDFVFEGVGVRAPKDMSAFKLTANSSSVTMQGSFSNTKIETHPDTQDPVLPTVNIAVSGGVVTGVTMTSSGSRIRSPIVCRVRGSSTNRDAVIVFRINFETGQASEVTLLDGGSGYANAAAVQLNMEGGGVPLIWLAGPQAIRLSGVRLNLGNKTYGVGVLLAGGWYHYYRDVGVDYESIGSKGFGVIEDSRDGPIGTGSYDAAYVNTFVNVRAGRAAFIGLDDKTPTTHLLQTFECTYLHLHLCRDFLFNNAVIQGAGDCLVETVFCDNTTFAGGDCEGAPAYIHRSRGSNANTRFYMRRDATSGAGNYIGEPGTGSVYHFAHSNGTEEPEWIGSGGTAGIAYRNVGWPRKHRLSIPYSGDTLVMSSNIRLLGPDGGVLDDPTAPGQALIMVSGRYSYRIAYPGTGTVTVSEFAYIDTSGASLPAGGVKVAGKKVLGEQADAIDPALPADDKAEALRVALEGHGIIKTWGT